VLRAFLNLSGELELRNAIGKLFHSFGAHTENAHSPQVFVNDLG
jgi:hypothetical protein